ncbi:DEAD/DEAH box helicase family protein [Gordonia sp. IITR100]|uniref:DEAD/DEAH box helicase n=1 Tax=Gordonia sp. IITR100 TaxID=1314686 RepID=UPI000990E060
MSRLAREVDALKTQLAEYFEFGAPSEADLAEEEPNDEPSGASLIQLKRREQRPALFDYQKDLVNEALDGHITGGNAALISLPTGAGKTRTGISVCLACFDEYESRRVIWLAPTRELVHQAFGAALDLWQQYGSAPDIAVSRDFRDLPEPTLIITTPQAVHRAIREGRDLGVWDLVVFDEAHQAVASTFRTSVEALRMRPRAGIGKAALLGLSATPGRSVDLESYSLSEFFDNRLLVSQRLGPNPVLTLQRRGVLANLRFRKLTKQSIGKNAEVTRLRIAVEAVRSLVNRGRKPLVFSSSVAAAICLAEVLTTLGISATAVYSEMSEIARDRAISSFALGTVDVLVNYRLLATGYDCPAVTDVLLLNEVGSAIQFEQIVGRVARGPLTGGSRFGTVWEFDEHLQIHGLPTSYYRYRDFDWA